MGTMRSHKGQMIFAEQMVLFFIVISAVVATTVYVQRALQARVRNAKIYMVDAAYNGCAQVTSINGVVCNGTSCVTTNSPAIDCAGAANVTQGHFDYEYEPYYAVVNSLVGKNSAAIMTEQINGVVNREFADQVRVNSESRQLPPSEAR